MRIIKRERVTPFTVIAGDTVEVSYNRKVLLTAPITQAEMFNEVIIGRMDEDEQRAMGVASSLGAYITRVNV